MREIRSEQPILTLPVILPCFNGLCLKVFITIDLSQINSKSMEETIPQSFHIVAIPYPGRGHINPLINLCKLISTTKPNIQINFIVTEEWLSLLKFDLPNNFRIGTIPNVIPSETVRAKDFVGFIQAVFTKMEGPVDSVIEQLPDPVNLIVSDSFLPWVLRIGERRNIPVASFWPMSATVFSIFYHHELLVANGHSGANLSEQGEELVDYIPGITSIRVKDLPSTLSGRQRKTLPQLLESISQSTKAQYMLFTTIEALESQVIEALKAKFPVPIVTVGLTIPYLVKSNEPVPNYFSWLDDQPKDSVLYISHGSFLSISDTQLYEIIAGVCSSGIRFFMVALEGAAMFKDGVGNRGMVVPWCDQLKVLSHPSVGGFWSHCGWNSTKEGAFAGVPFLTFPIAADQVTNSKKIVEDWKIGWRINNQSDDLVKKEEIALLLQRFMDCNCYEGREMRRRATEIRKICQETIESGIIEQTIDNFIQEISLGRRN